MNYGYLNKTFFPDKLNSHSFCGNLSLSDFISYLKGINITKEKDILSTIKINGYFTSGGSY